MVVVVVVVVVDVVVDVLSYHFISPGEREHV